MQRRSFAGWAGAVVLPAWTDGAWAQPAGWRPADGYLVRDEPMAAQPAVGKIEVVDFFWYSCPHCNAFEPALEAWVKKLPADVQLRRNPVAFRPDFEAQQRLYFTLEAMGLVEPLHARVFAAIHVSKQRLDNEDTILSWATKQKEVEVDAARFAQVYRSFAVAGKARAASQKQNEYSIGGVPALGIAGRYYVDGTTAGSMGRALQIVDSRISAERTARKS